MFVLPWRLKPQKNHPFLLCLTPNHGVENQGQPAPPNPGFENLHISGAKVSCRGDKPSVCPCKPCTNMTQKCLRWGSPRVVFLVLIVNGLTDYDSVNISELDDIWINCPLFETVLWWIVMNIGQQLLITCGGDSRSCGEHPGPLKLCVIFG